MVAKKEDNSKEKITEEVKEDTPITNEVSDDVEEIVEDIIEEIDSAIDPIIEISDDVKIVKKSSRVTKGKDFRGGNSRAGKESKEAEKALDTWVPKTEIGTKVKNKEITDIDEILGNGIKVLEPEIIDTLLPNMDIELLAIGQSKGKFGGGQRRVFRQTQKKTREGNKPKFSTFAVCGNYNGYIGFGYGKAKETVPAREKAFRQCKINLVKIRRACSSWQCKCGTPHTIPFKVKGKCGSVVLTLMPAPKGTGLCAEKEIAKILKLAGIKDIWSKSKGKTTTKINHIKACQDALLQLTRTKIKTADTKNLNIVDGKLKVNVEK